MEYKGDFWKNEKNHPEKIFRMEPEPKKILGGTGIEKNFWVGQQKKFRVGSEPNDFFGLGHL